MFFRGFLIGTEALGGVKLLHIDGVLLGYLLTQNVSVNCACWFRD